MRTFLNVFSGLVKVFERRQKECLRGGNGRVLHRESFLYNVSVFIYESYILSFEVKKVRCGPRVWVVNQLIWDPKVLFIKR